MIQSLSICVPAGCPNNCKFCVSKMHREDYKNSFNKDQYSKRMLYARDNGCNSMIFTGTGEAIYNREFMNNVAQINREMYKPFRMIELQTSGVGLDKKTLIWLRNEIGITTISLSLSSLDSDINQNIVQTPNKLKIDIEKTC